MNKPEVIIVHHSGGTKADPLADTSHHTFDIIKNYHVSLGWGDIGYHWLIEKSGKICKGRDEKVMGAHTIGMNDKSIGICVVGNFDSKLPTAAQEESLKVVYKDIISRYPALTGQIFPHRTFANRTCYGKNLADNWAQTIVIDKEEIVPPSMPTFINNKEYMIKLKKIKSILTCNRMKSLYWRTGMMFLAIVIAGILENLDIFATVFSPAVTTMLGLILGEISKALNNMLSKSELI